MIITKNTHAIVSRGVEKPLKELVPFRSLGTTAIFGAQVSFKVIIMSTIKGVLISESLFQINCAVIFAHTCTQFARQFVKCEHTCHLCVLIRAQL